MKKLFATLVLLSLVSCAPQERSPRVSPDGAAAWMASHEDVQILDVRTPAEYAESHLQDAILVTWGEPKFAERAHEALDAKAPTLVYCRSGRRSTAAYEVLEETGFTQLRNLDGGILAWQAAGKPVISSE